MNHVDPIQSGLSAQASGAPAKPASMQDLTDAGAFMQLLLAQMRNQNPLDPIQDREFMSQLTQLNSLNELRQLNQRLEDLAYSNSVSQAAALIGKQITAQLSETRLVNGVVTGLTVDGNNIMLLVDGERVPLSTVTRVDERKG